MTDMLLDIVRGKDALCQLCGEPVVGPEADTDFQLGFLCIARGYTASAQLARNIAREDYAYDGAAGAPDEPISADDLLVAYDLKDHWVAHEHCLRGLIARMQVLQAVVGRELAASPKETAK